MNCKTLLYIMTDPLYLDDLQFSFPELHAQILPMSASSLLCLHEALQGSSYGSMGQEWQSF